MIKDPESGKMVDPNQIGEGELTEEQLIYKENIIDHFRNPRHKQRLDNPTATFHDMNPFCGDTLEVFLDVKEGVVHDIGFQGKGCGNIASCNEYGG